MTSAGTEEIASDAVLARLGTTLSAASKMTETFAGAAGAAAAVAAAGSAAAAALANRFKTALKWAVYLTQTPSSKLLRGSMDPPSSGLSRGKCILLPWAVFLFFACPALPRRVTGVIHIPIDLFPYRQENVKSEKQCIIVEFREIFCYNMNWVDGFYLIQFIKKTQRKIKFLC